ncbi:MAG: alpha/beta hydrolase [Deltaproteobacteria bacterium]|nr:alpha/beta hydrolase [Deltaproteobacteria bacterium]
MSFGPKQSLCIVLLIVASCAEDNSLTGDGGIKPKADSSIISGAGGSSGASGTPSVSGGTSGGNEEITPVGGGGGTTEEENLCGNGLLDPNEQCDGLVLNNATCETLGYTGGTLSCNSQCLYDDSMCVRTEDAGYGDPGNIDSSVGVDSSKPVNNTPTTGNGIPADHCLAGIDTYASTGPFTYRTARLGTTNAYVPDVPAGCKVPMVHYSNGTGAMCLMYAGIMTRLASNGFIALCYENANTGAGTFGITAFQAALEAYPDIADYRFGSTGHSQGGMAAFNTLAYAENEWGDQGIYAALPMEPASGFGANPREGWQNLYGSINSPVFMFSGLVTDTLVSQGWVQQAFNALDDATEAYFYAKSGANHIATISIDGAEVVVSWFRWKLLGDSKACEYFKAIPDTNPAWSLVDSQNEQPCN